MASNSRKYLNYLYIIFCSVTLLGALSMGYLMPSKAKTIDEQRVKEITLRVHREVASMKKEASAIAKTILTKGLKIFMKSNFSQKYHFYIYRKDELKYWTNYRFVPDYQQVKGQYRTRMIRFRNGHYLTLKTTVAHPKEGQFEVFSLLPVYIKYPISNTYLKSGYNSLIISDDAVKISLKKNKKHRNIFSKNKNFLFSLEASNTLVAKNLRPHF